nr:hypothetical protein [Tanacetum cinerariifolium]
MNGDLRLRLMRLAKKVRGTVEASESFREIFVKMMGKEALCYKTSCRTCSRLIFGAERCFRTFLYRRVNRESKKLEFVTDEIIEEGIIDQISRDQGAVDGDSWDSQERCQGWWCGVRLQGVTRTIWRWRRGLYKLRVQVDDARMISRREKYLNVCALRACNTCLNSAKKLFKKNGGKWQSLNLCIIELHIEL